MNDLTIRRVPLTELHADPGNARLHPEANLRAIQGSLARHGQAEPLVVQRGTGRVIAGHGRMVAMQALGWTHADVCELDVNETQAAALALALNQTALTAEWDYALLGKALEALKADGELEGTGFTEAEFNAVLDRIIADNPMEVSEDDVPEPPDAATSRRGDIWICGRHRAMCGDSAEWSDVEKLLAGAEIHLFNGDAPYGVRVEPRSNNAIAAGLSSFTNTHHQGLDLARHPEKSTPTTAKLRAKDRPLVNDYLPEAEFAALLRKWFNNAARALLPGRGFYAWGGYGNLGNFPPALAEAGLYFSQAVVWNKLHPVLTRKDMLGAFELAFYGWKEGAAHQFFGPTNATDLWEIKKLNHTAMEHLTQKPVELAARAIQYSSRPGENVLDLFGGSGWSMAAAEQTNRNAYLCEIDELYADVIVDRWQKLTGKEATLEATGETFAQTKESRS